MKKWLIALSLIIICLSLLLPPIIYHYVYPNGSDDSAYHIQYIENLKNHISGNPVLYFGRAIVSNPIIWINNLTHIPIYTLFTWFNYIMLCLSVVVIYIVYSKLINWQSGLVSVFVIILFMPSLLNMFDSGLIYDLISLVILLPIILYFLTLCVISKNKYWIFGAILVMVLFVLFHAMGIFGIKQVDSEDGYTFKWFVNCMIGLPNIIIIVLSSAYLVYKYGNTGD